MCKATFQCELYWEDLVLSHRGKHRSSPLERRVDEIKGENQGLCEDLDLADEQLAQEHEWATLSDETIVSLEHHVASLQDELVARQHELTTAREQPRDHGAPSFPQWGRGQGAYPSNFSNSRPQGNVFTAPLTVQLREQPAFPWEIPPTNLHEDADNDWSPPTQMRSVGNSVILTIDKQQFEFSGEAAKNAQSAYQKGHLPPVSQGVKHFGNLAIPLTTNDIDRLLAHAREGRGKAISQVEQYGHMLTTASERGVPLSDVQLYGLACWRELGMHNASARPSMRPGTRAPRIAQPTYNDHPSAWTEWLRAYDCHRAGVLINNDGGGNSSTRQHFMQQSNLLLMLPGQNQAITERFNISISLMHVLGPMQNFGPNLGMIDIARELAYQGFPWGEVDDVCLYGRTLTRHLLTADAPLLDTIHQVLQGYKLRVSSADLTAWYGEDLPSGMAPAPALVGPALVKAFATSSRTVVPPVYHEASNHSAGHSLLPIPGPQDQDQDMGGPTASSETGAANSSSSDTTVVDHIVAEPMEVESPLSLLSSEPELSQEGAGVRDVQGPLP
ncbi:hypothetical protein BDN67DRAFT_1017036 [Paxillus ammoniavirescens]|nr:hypothetical protein BDN67DRAFT_1017036 [Paxillus ammoniavirescens]